MFFIISKLLILLISPFTWITIALLCAILFKNPGVKRRCVTLALIILIIFSNGFLLNQFADYWDIDTTNIKGKYSCAIILGGFVSEDQYGEGYFNGSSDRFIQAVKLKTSGTGDNLLFTGGNANLMPGGFREAEWLSRQLRYFKIPDTCVLIEKEARNTLENAKFSKTLLEEMKLPPPYLLVTSAYHMRRSLLTFRRAGVDVIPYSCNYIAGQDKVSFNDFLPSVHVLSTWNTYIKEIIGYVVYYLKTGS